VSQVLRRVVPYMPARHPSVLPVTRLFAALDQDKAAISGVFLVSLKRTLFARNAFSSHAARAFFRDMTALYELVKIIPCALAAPDNSQPGCIRLVLVLFVYQMHH